MTQIHTGTLKHSHQTPLAVADQSLAIFLMLLSQFVSPSALICPDAQNVSQVKGILVHSSLKVETEVKQSGVCFLVWHSLPAPSALLVRTGLYSWSVLRQMTPGFPTTDHNNKNTPTAYCSHLLLERHHPLSPSFSYTPISLAVCNSSSLALVP